jgi:sensor histidine kinase YesM
MENTGGVSLRMPHRLAKSVFRLATITCPLFGFFGATPIFAINSWDFNRVVMPFFFLTSLTLCFWTVNYGLFVIWERKGWLNRSATRYLLSALICSALIIFLAFLISRYQLILPADAMPETLLKAKLKGSMYLMPLVQTQSMNLIIIVLLELLVLKDVKSKVDVENAALRMASLEARHNQLKQQLHPHFLFNSLNTLRSLINRSPEQAEDYLIRLSDLLRSSMSNSNQGLVSIYEELVMTNNYLYMQQVRFGDALVFSVPLDDASRSKQIVPIYAIQLLVENAIKHNILTQQQPLRISIVTNTKKGIVIVSNNFQPKQNWERESGIGLQNLTERYRLLSDRNIQIHHTEEVYEVQIPLLDPTPSIAA